MGSMFKVLAISEPNLTTLAGFATTQQADETREHAMTLGSPLLSAIPGLHHAFFTREGGVSDGIYASLNGGIGSKTIRRMSRKTAAGWRSRWA